MDGGHHAMNYSEKLSGSVGEKHRAGSYMMRTHGHKEGNNRHWGLSEDERWEEQKK